MKNKLQKLAFQYITPALCVLSLSSASIDAQNCCPDPCGTDWGCILIPVLAGAAAGAGVAAAMDNRGKKGHRGHRGPAGENGQDGTNGLDGLNGERGPQGERGRRGEEGRRGPRGNRGPRGHQGEPGDPWIADVGQELTFDFSLALLAGLSGATGDIVPFVEAPDGRVLEAAHFDPTSVLSQSTSVTITNPLYGTYHFGYFIPSHSNAAAISVTIANAVETSRDSTVTDYDSTETLAAVADSVQLTSDFTYFINDDSILP